MVIIIIGVVSIALLSFAILVGKCIAFGVGTDEDNKEPSWDSTLQDSEAKHMRILQELERTE